MPNASKIATIVIVLLLGVAGLYFMTSTPTTNSTKTTPSTGASTSASTSTTPTTPTLTMTPAVNATQQRVRVRNQHSHLAQQRLAALARVM